MGYNKTDIDKYWSDVKECLKNTDKKQSTIWATGNNGQITYDQNDNKMNIEQIGQWTYAEKLKKGIGKCLKNMYANMHFVQ